MADTPLDPAAVERERIVEWLRKRMQQLSAIGDQNSAVVLSFAVTDIERLDHLKDRPDDR